VHLTTLLSVRQISSKHLRDQGLRIPVDVASPSHKSGSSVGKIFRRDKTYEICISTQAQKPRDRAAVRETEDGVAIGEEILSLKCYVPRRSKANDQYYQAPLPIARHFVITQSAVLPTPTPPEQKLDFGPQPPRPQPVNRLVHVFKPIGSTTEEAGETNRVPASAAMQVHSPIASTPPLPSPERKKKKQKRDKSEDDKSRKKVKKEVGAGLE